MKVMKLKWVCMDSIGGWRRSPISDAAWWVRRLGVVTSWTDDPRSFAEAAAHTTYRVAGN